MRRRSRGLRQLRRNLQVEATAVLFAVKLDRSGPRTRPAQGVPRPGDRSFGSRFIEHMCDAFEALAQARSMAEAGAR